MRRNISREILQRKAKEASIKSRERLQRKRITTVAQNRKLRLAKRREKEGNVSKIISDVLRKNRFELRAAAMEMSVNVSLHSEIRKKQLKTRYRQGLRVKRKADRDILIEGTVEKVYRRVCLRDADESNNVEVGVIGENISANEFADKLVKAYENTISLLPEYVCTCCKKFLFQEKCFCTKVFNEMTEMCDVPVGSHVCSNCKAKLERNKFPTRSRVNNLDVLPAPDVLKQLNFLERRFVSRVQTFMTLLTLPKGGQYAQKGLAVHFMCEPQEIFCCLPRMPVDSGIICCSGAYKGFIKPSTIVASLKWLNNENKHFRHIDIDENALIEFDSVGVGTSESDFSEMIQTGTVSIDYQFPDVSLRDFLSVKLPWVSKPPISFFEYKHTEIMAFPWLFPQGENDFDAEREHKISLLDYLQSRFFHSDRRFRCDIPYLIVAVNRYESAKLKTLVNVYLSGFQKLGNNRCITAGELRQTKPESELGKNSVMFMKNIRGTAAFWKDELYNILARIRTLGTPDIFMSLSVDDIGWPELQEILRFDMGEDYTNAQESVKNNPVLVVLYAYRRLLEILKYIKESKILGEVTDYYVRFEFQNRGSVHFHVFLWLKKRPKTENGQTEAEVVAYIDKIISTDFPDKEKERELYDLVCSKQVHGHTQTCQGNRKRACRFFYPRRACDTTRLLYECERVTSRNHFYETKRSENAQFVNAYNPKILKRWRANMDIQLIDSAKGVVYYIAKYISKAEPDELRSELMKTIQEMDEKGQLNQKQRMIKLGFCMLKTRRMSAQEGAVRICSIPMIISSRSVVKVNTFQPEKRWHKYKQQSKLDQLSDTSKDVFDVSLLDLYRDRPESLNELSLFQFGSWFEKSSENVSGALQTLSQKHYIKKRTKQCCVRSTFVNISNEDYYFNLMMLHLPHRTDNDIIDQSGSKNCMDTFLEKQSQLNTNDLGNDCFANEVMEAAQKLLTAQALEKCMENDDEDEECDETFLVPEGTQFDEQITETTESPEQPSTSVSAEEINEMNANEVEVHSTSVNSDPIRLLCQKIKTLSRDQKLVMRYIHCKTIAKKEQMLLYMGGNAGVGKSHLLHVIMQWYRLTFARLSGQDPVVPCALTGIAAKHIHGSTLHSMFTLPRDHEKYTQQFSPLNGKALDSLKSKLAGVSLIIIDEISMVNDKMLRYINNRLQEVGSKTKDFGGFHVILTGDFLQLRSVRPKYAFECKELFDKFDILWLNENMRQKEDKPWCRILDHARVGKLTDADVKVLESKCFMADELSNVKVDLRLYPTKKMVNAYNAKRQQELDSNTSVSMSQDVYSVKDFDSGCQISEENMPDDDRDAGGFMRSLELTKNTKIMLIKNMTKKLVNGSLGRVHSIEMNGDNIATLYVKFDDPDAGIELQDPNRDFAIPIKRITMEYQWKGRFMTRTQFPIMQAWAVTIHKAEGLTLDSAIVNISECFAAGQAYVALSRVRQLKGLYIEMGPKQTKFTVSKIFASKEAMEAILGFKYRYISLKKSPWLKSYVVADWMPKI